MGFDLERDDMRNGFGENAPENLHQEECLTAGTEKEDLTADTEEGAIELSKKTGEVIELYEGPGFWNK